VETNKRENSAEVAVPTAETGINVVHEHAKHALSTKPPKEEKKLDAATAQDCYCNFRTRCETSLPHCRYY
jgi:chitin synthase